MIKYKGAKKLMNINEVILKIKNFNNCELDEPKGIPKIF